MKLMQNPSIIVSALLCKLNPHMKPTSKPIKLIACMETTQAQPIKPLLLKLNNTTKSNIKTLIAHTVEACLLLPTYKVAQYSL